MDILPDYIYENQALIGAAGREAREPGPRTPRPLGFGIVIRDLQISF